MKCSGGETLCSRCNHLGIVCKFNEKGLSGRPRRWSLNGAGELQHHPAGRLDEQISPTDVSKELAGQDGTTAPHTRTLSVQYSPWDLSFNLSPNAPGVTIDSTLSISQEGVQEPQTGMTSTRERDKTVSLLNFDTRAQLDVFPLDPFRACLPSALQTGNPTELSFSAFGAPTEDAISCDCSRKVFKSIRILERTPDSHEIVHKLRGGLKLVESLLTCHICYDVSRSMAFTLRNVMLVGRMSLEVTTHYHRYLGWVKEYCAGLAGNEPYETVHLGSGPDTSTKVGFKISSDKLYDLITYGLQDDVQRLSNLGTTFATRQHNRHLVGHETCLNLQGRCWKDTLEIDPDPSDVCPQSPVARVLTPCYRIVDEVRARFKELETALSNASIS